MPGLILMCFLLLFHSFSVAIVNRSARFNWVSSHAIKVALPDGPFVRKPLAADRLQVSKVLMLHDLLECRPAVFGLLPTLLVKFSQVEL